MNRSTRPLTEKQLEELRGVVAPSMTIVRAVLFLLAAAIVAKLFHVLQQLLGMGAERWWWLLPTAGVMAGVFLFARRWTGGMELRRQVRRDIAGGVASTLRIEAVSAIEVEEQEDEGPGFVIRTPAGEAVLFAGQYLEGPKRHGFPWREFEILEAPGSGLFLDLRRLGEPLAVQARMPPLSYRQGRDLGIHERRYVVLDERRRSILENGGAS